MPDQLDVHRNPGRNKSVIPICRGGSVEPVQRGRPPRCRAAGGRQRVWMLDSDVGPHFVIDGGTVVLDPLQITSVPGDLLGPSVAPMTGEGDRVMRALDILLSRAWR